MDIPTERERERESNEENYIKCLLDEISIENMISHLKFNIAFFTLKMLYFLLNKIAIKKKSKEFIFDINFNTKKFFKISSILITNASPRIKYSNV